MGTLNSFNQEDVDIVGEEDRIGGRGLLDSKIYDFVIEGAYLDKSKGGAHCVVFNFKTADGQFYRETLYFTNKQEKTYWTDKGGEKHFLPGYNVFNSICLLSVGKPFNVLDTEDKVVDVFNFNTKELEPVTKEVIPSLIGSHISLGILNTVDNKAKPDPNNPTGKYKDTNEKKTFNEIDKVFRTKDGLTTVEVRAQKNSNDFQVKWAKRWEGQVNDKFKLIEDMPTAEEEAEAKPTPTDLFG